MVCVFIALQSVRLISHTLPPAEAPLAVITALRLLEYDKLCTPGFREFLPFFTADPLKVSPEVFDCVQVRALAGPLKGIYRVLAVWLGSLSLWKVNLQLSLRSSVLWTKVSRIILYFSLFSFRSSLTSQPVPATEQLF